MERTRMKPAKIIGLLLVLALVAGLALALTRPDEAGQAGDESGRQPAPPAETPSQEPEADKMATYTIEYKVVWSPETHPETLPAGAHVSPIVIISHKNEGDLFAAETLATDGIEIMAETGATAVLMAEIEANQSIFGSAAGRRIDVPGSNILEIEFDQDHPLLSAVSMLAPSPDWFVAVDNVNLFDGGQWLDKVELPMRPYDAGTDSIASFSTDDLDTDPAGTIGPPVDDEFIQAAAEGDFARLIITKI